MDTLIVNAQIYQENDRDALYALMRVLIVMSIKFRAFMSRQCFTITVMDGGRVAQAVERRF